MFGVGSYIKKIIRNKKLRKRGIEIGFNTELSRDVVLEPPVRVINNFVSHSVRIGGFTYVESGGAIYDNVSIGKYCSIARNVYIGVPSHPTTWLSTHPFQYSDWLSTMQFRSTDYKLTNQFIEYRAPKQTTHIGNDVWIGTGVIIKSGITISDGVIIGAGSIVVKDIPPYAIVVGNPGRIIKYRFAPETIKILCELKWWDMPLDMLANVKFDNIEQAIKDLQKITQ